MIRALEDAIAKLSKLPEDRQAYVAEVLEQIAGTGGDLFVIPDEHLAGVLEGLAEAERGEFVSDDDMAAFWKSAACEASLRSACTRRY
jgi:predicted transcriptional regulator